MRHSDFTIGQPYYQRICGKWLTYEGEDSRQPGWYNFSWNGKLYNQLRESDLKMMFSEGNI